MVSGYMDFEKALRQAKASIEIEGYTVKDEYAEIVRLVLEKKISEEEFHRSAWEMIGD